MKIRQIKEKNNRIRKVTITTVVIIFIFFIIKANIPNKDEKNKINTTKVVSSSRIDKDKIKSKQLEWNLTLVNSENELSKDYKITLESIDEYREFDSRAIHYLKNMLNDIRKDGIENIWVQSAYRSIEDQTKIYNKKVEEYKSKGKTYEEAKRLTEEIVNKPRCSDHNLGLAVDFNYVDGLFENTKAYKWLMENAENYGFILRYPKEKENITKVNYEPWHWRFVGIQHAKKMNELEMCLEEYVEYLNK